MSTMFRLLKYIFSVHHELAHVCTCEVINPFSDNSIFLISGDSLRVYHVVVCVEICVLTDLSSGRSEGALLGLR